VVNATPRPLYPPGKETRYPLSRRLGGPQGRSERARKISPPPGFYPPIVQPVASRYTDYAIPAHFTPGKDTGYPLYWRLGGSQGRSERARKISPPPGFYPPIVQPVASRYTDYAIPAHFTPGKDTRYPLYWRLGGP